MTTAPDPPDGLIRDPKDGGGARAHGPATALPAVAAHHLVIGTVIATPWLLLAPGAARLGVAPVVLLLVLVAVILPPVAFVVLRRRLTVEGLAWPAPAGGAVGAVRARLGLGRPSRSQVLRFGLPATAAAVVLPGMGLPVEAAVKRWGWCSGWPSTGVPEALFGPAEGPSVFGHRWVLLVLWVAVAVVVGPVVEEVLFRGVLQPLVPGGPWGRVLGGSALFAVYHLWQPGSWLTVWLATLPVAWVRERTGSTWLAAGAHVLVNAVALGMLLVGAMTR